MVPGGYPRQGNAPYPVQQGGGHQTRGGGGGGHTTVVVQGNRGGGGSDNFATGDVFSIVIKRDA